MVMANWDDSGYRRQGFDAGALIETIRFRGVGDAVRSVLGRAKRRHDARRAAARLLSVDPHILRDIGVSRADVLGILRRLGD